MTYRWISSIKGCKTRRELREQVRGPFKPVRRSKIRRVTPDVILDYYKSRSAIRRPPVYLGLSHTISNIPQGLGDCVVLTSVVEAARKQKVDCSIYSPSCYFQELFPYISGKPLPPGPFWAMACELNSKFDLGNGHFTQRLVRACGLPVNPKPKGGIVCKNIKRIPGRVAMHFDPGTHVNWQRRHIHLRARELYPENRKLLNKFVSRHQELECIELVRRDQLGNDDWYAFRDWQYKNTATVGELIEFLASCEYFVGIMSGPMHLATALGCKCVVIINFPNPNLIYLPTLKNIDQVESEWFYPQNVHLHQDVKGVLVPKLSMKTLEQSFAGEVYPYWSDDYLDLINAKF